MNQKSPLFTEITPEESSTVSGGLTQVTFDLNRYLFILGAGVLFGNSGLTPDEIQFAWEKAFVFENRPRFQFQRIRKRPTIFGHKYFN